MSTAPCHLWERENIPDTCVSYSASEVRSVEDAILSGAGIGFLSLWTASRTPNLVEMTQGSGLFVLSEIPGIDVAAGFLNVQPLLAIALILVLSIIVSRR